MSPSDSDRSLSANALEQMANVVEAFDRAWRAGTPSLEDFLGRVTAPDEQRDGTEAPPLRAALFSALLGVEIEYRRQRGETPQPTDYSNRFPDEVRRIEVACRPESERENTGPVTRALDGITPSIRAERSSAEAAAVPVTRLGPYLIERELGRGGMGVVYLARRPGASDRVAVKTLLPSCSADLATRFRREALATSKIDSDHVVKIYAVDEDAGRPYFVMPFVEGGQLHDLIATGPLLGTRAARLLEPVARALGELHRQGVLHRDLKPSNLLYDRARDRALLTDFGLAKLEQPDFAQTQAEVVFGTPSYMAPEQTRDAATVTVAADIYGLGATLYHLVTGQRPFHAATNIVDLMRMIREVDPPPARSIQPTVSRDLDAICQKCLEKKVERRYRSADELADELRAFLDGRPVLARPVSTSTRLTRWCGRNRLVTAFVGVVTLGLCLTSGLLVSTLLAFGRERSAKNLELKTARVLKTTNAELEREIVESRRQKNEAEGGRYDLILERAKTAFRERRFGELIRNDLMPPAGQIGWEMRRLEYESRLSGARLAALMGEHDGVVLDAVLSPDGRWLVSSGAEGLVMLWDARTHRAVRPLLNGLWSESNYRRIGWLKAEWPAETKWPPPVPCIADLEWLGSGNFLAAASMDGQGLLIDTATGEPRRLLRDDDALFAVAASSDGSRVLFGGRAGRLSLCEVDPAEVRVSSGEGDSQPVSALTAIGAGTSDIEASRITRQLGSPVLTLRSVDGIGWLVGCEDGRLLLLDERRLDTLAELPLTGPIWSVDAVNVAGRVRVVVGCQQPQLRVYDIPHGEAPSFRLAEVANIPAGDTPVTAIHSVRFETGGHAVCGVDQRGRVFAWSLDDQRLLWATAPNRAQAERPNLVDAQQRGWPYPKPLERAGSVAAFRSLTAQEAAELVGGGTSPITTAFCSEALVCTLEATVRRLVCAPESGRIVFTVPSEPLIAFDPQWPHLLWCLSDDGRVRLIDSHSGEVLDAQEAHRGPGRALVADVARRQFLTVGEDGVVQSWHLVTAADGARLQRGAFRLTHARPLLSGAVCPVKSLLAAVDEGASLLVWSLESGRLLHQASLTEGVMTGRPVTGAVAFDPAGKWLAACGPGNSLAVFELEPFARWTMPHLDLHGYGNDLIWSPGDPDVLVAADSYAARIMVRNARLLSVVESPLGGWQRSPITMTASPDGRRVFIVTEDGQVEVADSRRHRSMYTLNTGPGTACDVAVDANGGRVAVAFRDGRVEILESSHPEWPSSINVVQRETGWRMKSLVSAKREQFETHPRAMAVDPQGRVAFLALRGEHHFEELVYFEETADGVIEERVEAGGVELSSASVALTREATGQPVAVFRGGNDSNGTLRPRFEFDLRVARRTADAKWNVTNSGWVGNIGRYVCPVVRHGQLDQLVCYQEYPQILSHVRRSGTGWSPGSHLGRQGDGVGLVMGGESGEPLFGFNRRPSGATEAAPQVGWFEGSDWCCEVIDSNRSGIIALARQPDGTPLVLVRRADHTVLARRMGPGQWTHEPVPGFDAASLVCDAAGRVFVLEARTQGHHQLILWERTASPQPQRPVTWTRTMIERHCPAEPSNVLLRLDAHQRPVVVVAFNTPERKEVRVYRPN